MGHGAGEVDHYYGWGGGNVIRSLLRWNGSYFMAGFW